MNRPIDSEGGRTVDQRLTVKEWQDHQIGGSMEDDRETAFFGTADEFTQTCEIGIRRCRELPSQYNPTAWITMMHRYGAVAAAKRLLASGDMQSGFERLIREGHVELTVEWIVCQPRWNRLFNDRDRAAATWRLEQAGYGSRVHG